MKKNICFIFLIYLIFCVYTEKNGAHAAGENNTTGLCSKVTGLSYPPFKKPKHIDFTINELINLNLKKIKIAINWKNREPKKGVYNWQPFDYVVEKAQENNIKIFLTFPSDGPNWACSANQNKKSCVFKNEVDFKNYLVTFFTRYPNVMERVQFGNEWETHYVGSMAEFVTFNDVLYEITKQFSPMTKVVLGGISRAYPMAELQCRQNKELDFSGLSFNKEYSSKSLKEKINKALCNKELQEKVLYVFNNAKYDELDIHLYDDPENWRDYVELLPKDKNILVSEFGGPSSIFETTTEEYQAKRISVYLSTIQTLPVKEAYYFKLLDSPYSYHKHSGLFSENFNKKQSYDIFSNCTNKSALK